MLKLVKRLAYEKPHTYAPLQEDAVVQTNDIVSVTISSDDRGSGPFVRISLRDGTSLACVGRPEDFAEAAQVEVFACCDCGETYPRQETTDGAVLCSACRAKWESARKNRV